MASLYAFNHHHPIFDRVEEFGVKALLFITLVMGMFKLLWGFALDFPVTQDAINNAGNAQNNYWQNGPTKKTYYFDAINMVLKENDTKAGGQSLFLWIV
jgi:hypothetical protein